MTTYQRCVRFSLAAAFFTLAFTAVAQKPSRDIVSLNGVWDIEDGVSPDAVPAKFTHHVAVPGLVHSSVPAFENVDQYQTRQLLYNLMNLGRYSKADYEKLGDVRGTTVQTRQYFWYHRTFTAPAKRQVAILRVNKAQFSIRVYINGIFVGEHAPCFTAGVFDVTHALKWNAQNEIVIRVGAHPGVLPDNVSGGTDFEKNRWTPGIYDDVTLSTMDDAGIVSVQVAPHIDSSEVELQTVVRNYGNSPLRTSLKQTVYERVLHTIAGATRPTLITLAPGEERTIIQRVHLLHAHLWSPEDPFLYEARTSTSGDETNTRFGMREFRFDTATKRAYLNGHPYFMRGSNITLHRFFEDPESADLPWNEAWVHKLLVDIPKRLHWNSFRFCIGPVPQRWLEIADENGLLIQNEYFVWTANATNVEHPPVHYDADEMIVEYKEWMRDNWNHPSVVIWDATNESYLPEFTDKVIPAVRGLDLSNRPWENSYNAPAGPDDPVEDHEYLFYDVNFNPEGIERMMGPPPNKLTSKTGHALILNEYGWLWLNRDGTPTLLTDKLYPKLTAGRPDTTASRFALQNYFLAGETEFWRAYRTYAGVMHFVYLTASEPDAFTSDHFESVRELKLNPGFEHAMEQAFNPLGVYLNFWQPELKAGASKIVTVMMVSDENRERRGVLRLRIIDNGGKDVVHLEKPFILSALGAQSYAFKLQVPNISGNVSIDAVAIPDETSSSSVTSHRQVMIRN